MFLYLHSFLNIIINLKINSAIHKAAVHRSAGGRNDPQRPFPIDGFTAFSRIVRNGSAGGFVNSAVSNIFHQAYI